MRIPPHTNTVAGSANPIHMGLYTTTDANTAHTGSGSHRTHAHSHVHNSYNTQPQHALKELETEEQLLASNEELEDTERDMHGRLLELRKEHLKLAESLMVCVAVCALSIIHI